MKKLAKMMSLGFVLLLLMSSMTFAGTNLVGATAAEQDSEYTLEEMLEYALQDEKLAQAEYEVILNTFDVTNPFTNIAKAEITHEEALIGLYEARDIEIPTFDATDHVVIPETLSEIYVIGVEAEIANIAMYNTFLEQDLDDDVRSVFVALRDASESHLQAFERGVDKTIETSIATETSNSVNTNTPINSNQKARGNRW